MISVVISTKNEEKSLPRLFKSLTKQTLKNFETVVVDNYSTDKTVEVAKELTNKVYLKGPERSSQRNFGAKKATGAYLLFLDADMELQPGVLKELTHMTRNGVSCVIIPELSLGTGFWSKCRAFERKFYLNTDYEAPRFFLKEFFLALGGYNEDLIAAEDWNLAIRVKATGERVQRTKSLIIHNENKLSLLAQIKKKFYYGENLPKFAKIHTKFFFAKSNLVARPVFLKDLPKLLSKPKLTLGMLILKTLESVAFAAGFVKGLISDKRKGLQKKNVASQT